MTDEQFKAIKGFLLAIVLLLGFIAGIPLALAWQYL
jgi:hypothetical protein